jgi:hypothetical protein
MDTERGVANLSGDAPKVWQEPLPLGRDACTCLTRVSLNDSGDEKDLAVFKSHGWGGAPDVLLHLDRLQKPDTAKMALLSNRLGRQTELFAKGTGKGLVRTVPGVERDRQNVSRTTRARNA